jgi:hypothetical protein
MSPLEILKGRKIDLDHIRVLAALILYILNEMTS